MNENNFFQKDETVLGLKIDVDTYRGTKKGIPALIRLLNSEGIKATFFLSVGPDNMGRHIWRILKPKFLIKMFRGNAAKLYGLDILFKGFLWPGPNIGRILRKVLRLPAKFGHEVALHAYDHYKWQKNISKYTPQQIKEQIDKANRRWKRLFGSLPTAAGSPGWQLSEEWLKFADSEVCADIKYRSDTRGTSYGYPKYNNHVFKKLQIPTTLPTYDEVIGRNGVTNENYNEYILSQIEPGQLNVLTIHTEAEGIVCLKMFKEFIQNCKEKGIKIVSMGEIYERIKSTQQILNLSIEEIPGREGKLALLKHS